MPTLAERFHESVDQMEYHRHGSYQEWLAREVAWYRAWADELAIALNGHLGYPDASPTHVALLTKYMNERNLKDFDS